jgi:menaquinol-cytochrome c reductase iron-sulfur subunit
VLTRRELAALALASAAAPLAGCRDDAEPDRWYDVAAAGDISEETWLAAQFTPPAAADAGPWQVYLRRRGGDVVALDRACTHRGCPVRFIDSTERFICICHGGVFDDRGRPTGGPPKRRLRRRPARIVEGRVQVAWPS